MADPGENNPRKTVAPGSDNSEVGGAKSASTPPPDWDKDILAQLKEQMDAQKKQSDEVNKLSNRLLSNQNSIESARKKLQEEQSKKDDARDSKAILLAEKELAVAQAFQEENLKALGLLEKEMLKKQEDIDAAIDLLGESVGKNDGFVKKHLEITEDAKKIINKAVKTIADSELESSASFKQFLADFETQTKAERQFEEENTKRLDAIRTAVQESGDIPEGTGSDDEKITAIMQKTALSLESLATINEKIQDAMAEEGIDREDKAAVERFKVEKMMDAKFNESIIKELVKNRDSIKKETVQKELQEKYIKQGIPANLATVRAEKNAEEEFRRQKTAAAEQIRIFKNLDTTTKYQTSLVEADYRSRIEKEKESAGLPGWYIDLRKRLGGIDAGLLDLKNAFEKSGLLTKILMVLAIISGVVVGFIAESIRKIVTFFKTGLNLGKFIARLEEFFPTFAKLIRMSRTFIMTLGETTGITQKLYSVFNAVVTIGKRVFDFFNRIGSAMRTLSAGAETAGPVLKFLGNAVTPIVNIMKAFQVGLSVGTKIASGLFTVLGTVGKFLGKIFIPLGIALTVIDGIIGAFKGFKKDGLAGLIPGILSKILSGLTFGFVSFDSIYKVVKKVTDIIFIPLNIIFKVFGFIGSFFSNLWTLVKDLFSGKGIKTALSNFFGNMSEAFANLLFGIYDATVGAFLRLFGIGKETTDGWLDKAINFLSKYNPISLIINGFKWLYENGWKTIMELAQKALDFFKWANPLYLAYRGIKWLYEGGWKTIMEWAQKAWDILKWANPLYLAYRGIKWLYEGGWKTIMDWAKKAWDTLKWANPLYLAYRGIKWLYEGGWKTITDWAKKAWEIFKWANPLYLAYRGILWLYEKVKSIVPDAMQKIIDGVVGFIDGIWKGIKEKFGWLLSWFGIGDEEADKAEQQSKEPTKSKASLERENSGETSAQSIKRAREEKSLAESQARSKPPSINQQTVVNNNSSGGGKAQPPTLVAPQPPRNTEPTNRAMQWEAQPMY